MTTFCGARAARSLHLDLALAAAFALLIGCCFTSAAQAAPTARFTATTVQQPACVAPCAVHLDARATEDPQYERDFHTLDYEYSCGIAAAGRTPGTWQDGASRDVARGPITGCVYAEPGTYRVTLTVRAPDGETGTASTDVVVANASTEFADVNETWCIADSGTPGDAAFTACPNTNPANHVVATSFSAGLDACGARTAHRRCLFRSGDTFSVESTSTLSDAGGLIGAYDTGAAPLMTGSANRALAVGSNWTVSAIQFRLADDQGWPCGTHSDYINLGMSQSGMTVYDVTLNGLSARGVATPSGTGPDIVHDDRIAIVGNTMNASDTYGICGGALYLRAERALVIGNVIDGAGRVGGSTAYNIRTVHFRYGAFQHNRVRRPGPQDNNLQLRAWAQTATGPRNDPTQYVVIADNHFSAQNPTMGFIRTCQGDDCQTTPETLTDNEDVLIERNFFALEPGGTTTGQTLIATIQGGDTTIRNNVVDAQGVDFSARGSSSTLVMHAPSVGAGRNDSRIHVLNNTLYANDSGPRNVRVCDSSSVGTGHECHGNLVYVPNNTGTHSTTVGSGWSTPRNNLFATANPFVATPPAEGSTTPTSFELASSSAAKDAGDDFTGLTSVANVRDQAARCRPVAVNFDAGAREQGASACSGSTPPPVVVCGNALREAGEACDDGNLAVGDGCNATCAVEACGNGVRDSGETCDDGNLASGDGCNATCRVEACGNGVRDAGEACDDGNLAAGDGCDTTCRVEACGNGVRDSGEACDDGNLAAGDGCSAICRVEACGNGVREGAEACDDGNLASGDGCSATCSVEVAAVCGNHVREGSEACDDGNAVAGDGCRANCTAEVCGDGIRDALEACDDGNLVGGDGCRPGCSVERCGDGVRDANEGCDDGNLVSGDSCSSSCAVENDPAADEYWVDVGGAGYTGTDGHVWISDVAFANGGRVATSSYDVRSTNNDSLYQTRRFGATSGTPLIFNFPVTGTGPYRVRLHFAEMEPSVVRGMRVFNVVAEDAFTLRDLDIYRRVGPARPYVRDVYVNVDDGALTLRFEPQVGEPMISGIEIIRGDPPTAKPRFVNR